MSIHNVYIRLHLFFSSLYDQVQSALQGKDNLSQPNVFLSPGYGRLESKEAAGEISAAIDKEQLAFYSPLGEPNWKDLPFFSYQIALGMVCKAKSHNMWLKWSIVVYTLRLCTSLLFRSTSPPWVSFTVTWPAATSWWMRGSCSRYQTLVSRERHPSMCPPSRTGCH